MEMRSHTPRPQRQNPNISTGEFVPQCVRESLLARLVGVVHGFPGEGGSFEAGDGGDVEDCAGIAGDHGVAEDEVGGEHVAIDVGGVHGLDGGKGELVEYTGGSEG